MYINAKLGESGGWENYLDYAYTCRYEKKSRFIQMNDCVTNKEDNTNKYGYENVTVVTKEQYGEGTTFSVSCAFDKTAAPLFILTDGLFKDEEGDLRFGDYIEIVLYANGINVWQMYTDEDNIVRWNQLMSMEFPVEIDKKHTLSAKIGNKSIYIYFEDKAIMLRIPDMPKKMNIGITACEGITKFYDLSVLEAK